MTIAIQTCTISDLRDMLDLLVEDARQRHVRNPGLWAFDDKARSRIETILCKSFEVDSPFVKEHWLIARKGRKPVGITRSIIVPVPPIYKVETPPGLMLDECFAAEDATTDTIQELISATEAKLRDAGTENFIASCCTGSPWRPILEKNGYEPVTLFMSKRSSFEEKETLPPIEVATEDDIPGIISRSAEHRSKLFETNPIFWNINPNADEIFKKWMRVSLTLNDRSMLVAKNSGKVDGYIIAQPVTPVQMPMTHDPSGIGAIDDFYHIEFENRSDLKNGGAEATELFTSAEGAFARDKIRDALVVCPDKWSSKKQFLTDQGYSTAKTWLFKA